MQTRRGTRLVTNLLGICALSIGLIFAAKKCRSRGKSRKMGSILSYIASWFACDKDSRSSIQLSNGKSPSESLDYLAPPCEEAELSPNLPQKNPPPAFADNRSIQWRGNAASVEITGSFRGWGEPVPLEKVDDSGIFTVYLEKCPAGRVEFKFIVDGVWMCSEDYPKCDNGMGGHNNFTECP